jgi:hypothetical protein
MKQSAFNLSTGKHMAIFDFVVASYFLDEEGKDRFVPAIKHMIEREKLNEVKNKKCNSLTCVTVH